MNPLAQNVRDDAAIGMNGRWRDPITRRKVRRTLGAMWYELYEVPETSVKATVRSKVQG